MGDPRISFEYRHLVLTASFTERAQLVGFGCMR